MREEERIKEEKNKEEMLKLQEENIRKDKEEMLKLQEENIKKDKDEFKYILYKYCNINNIINIHNMTLDNFDITQFIPVKCVKLILVL
jgi:hypothetical protein